MKYEVIYADCPWPQNARRRGTKFGPGAGGHYPLMRAEQILELGGKIKAVTADNCALFLWATWPRLPLALQVIEAWGFNYKTLGFIWVKPTQNGGWHSRIGNYTGSNSEPVLLGIRGSMPVSQKLVNQVIAELPRQHSVKPENVRARIEILYPNRKYLELFGRKKVEGWTVLGNAITHRDIAKDLEIEILKNVHRPLTPG